MVRSVSRSPGTSWTRDDPTPICSTSSKPARCSSVASHRVISVNVYPSSTFSRHRFSSRVSIRHTGLSTAHSVTLCEGRYARRLGSRETRIRQAQAGRERSPQRPRSANGQGIGLPARDRGPDHRRRASTLKLSAGRLYRILWVLGVGAWTPRVRIRSSRDLVRRCPGPCPSPARN